MEILRDPILNYARIISNKYKIPLKKIKPLIDSSWTFKITSEIIKEPLYVDDNGNKYIIIDNNTGIKLLY